MKQLILFSMIFLTTTQVWAQLGTIHGRVIDSQGNPIAGVEMTFTKQEMETYKQVIESKPNGTFLLTGLNPGEHYQIYLKVEGFNDQIYGPFRAWIGKNDEAIEIDMQTIEEAMAAQGISTEAEPTPDSLCRDAYNAAVGFYQQKQWAEGISKLDESLVHLADIPAEEQGEDLNNIYKLYALFAFEMQDWQKTIEYGNKFLAIKPDQQSIVDRVRFAEKELAGPEPAEIYNEAIGFLNANDDAKAKQVLSGLAQSAPEYALTYFQLGKIETREFEFDNAVNYYKKFLKMSEGSTDPVVIKLREEAKDLIVTLLE